MLLNLSGKYYCQLPLSLAFIYIWNAYIYIYHTYIYIYVYIHTYIFFKTSDFLSFFFCLYYFFSSIFISWRLIFLSFVRTLITAKGWIQKLFWRHQELSAYHSVYLMMFKCLSLARFLTVGRMDWVCHFQLVNAIWQMFSKSWLNN